METKTKQSNPNTTPRTERKPATPEKTKRNPAKILQAYETAQKALQDLQAQEQSKATARKLAAAKKRLATLAKAVDDCGIITAFTVQAMGERIAGKLLKTIYSASGDTMIKRLFDGLIIDKNVRLKDYLQNLSDGYDIAQTATTFLCGYMGKTLFDAANDGTTDKDGNPATILRACFRKCRAYIYAQAQRQYKNIYIDNPETGELSQVPEFWDTPTYNDFTAVNAAINGMNLTARQMKILAYRLRGKSIHQIAKILSVHKSTIQEHLQAIGKKYKTYAATTEQN